MRCSMKVEKLRLDGPVGPVTVRSHCEVHGFMVPALWQAEMCPLGQIEDATEKALALIGGPQQAVEVVSVSSPAETFTAPAPKRTRKPKGD